jgi:hypothetical protein
MAPLLGKPALCVDSSAAPAKSKFCLDERREMSENYEGWGSQTMPICADRNVAYRVICDWLCKKVFHKSAIPPTYQQEVSQMVWHGIRPRDKRLLTVWSKTYALDWQETRDLLVSLGLDWNDIDQLSGLAESLGFGSGASLRLYAYPFAKSHRQTWLDFALITLDKELAESLKADSV